MERSDLTSPGRSDRRDRLAVAVFGPLLLDPNRLHVELSAGVVEEFSVGGKGHRTNQFIVGGKMAQDPVLACGWGWRLQ
jgi:hypothetical protein